MIEINLLPGKKRAAPGGGFKLRLPDFGALLANVRNPWLIGAAAAWVLLLGIAAAVFISQAARLAVLNSRLESVQAEKKRFDVVIAQKRQAEKIRDSLVSEINIIRGIDADRYVWPHILDQVTKALPPYTWLTGVATQIGAQPGQAGAPTAPGPVDTTAGPAVRFSIEGRTVDIEAYTTFLRQLAASPWLSDVTPATAQTVIESDRPLTSFTIGARYRLADSVYIRTVPLIQSVQ